LRKTVYIIGHLCHRCEFVPGAVKILGVMGESCTKKKPSVSSSKKGRNKVSGGNKRLQKKKNKRTPDDQSPTLANSRDQSLIEINFKKALYERPDHPDDSDMGTVQDLKIFLSWT